MRETCNPPDILLAFACPMTQSNTSFSALQIYSRLFNLHRKWTGRLADDIPHNKRLNSGPDSHVFVLRTALWVLVTVANTSQVSFGSC